MMTFTPGPWKWWTSNSWKRLKRDDHGITWSVLEPYVSRDGHPDCAINEADMALIAAAPALYEALKTLSEPHWSAISVDSANITLMLNVIAEMQSIARAALASARGEETGT